MSIPRIPVSANPKLFDLFINQFNENLGNKVAWLDYLFGQCENQTTLDKHVFPTVYAGQNIENEYIKVFPDEFFGSSETIKGYCFWLIDNPTYDSTGINSNGVIKAKASLIFWFNLKEVLNDSAEFRNWDKVIDELLKAIRESNQQIQGQATPTGWTRKPKEIFKEYSLDVIDGNTFAHPFAGVRFYLDVMFKEGNKPGCGS